MILNSAPLVLLRYWIFQGVMCMNRVEILHRFLLEGLVFAAVFLLLPAGLCSISAVLIAFLIAHTLSATFNGHPFAVLAHDAGVHSVCYYRNPQRFLAYVEDMHERTVAKSPDYLDGALIFGSIVRGIFRETSDLDIRYIARPGFLHAFRTAHLVFIERLRATLCGFPMDIYMFLDADETRGKMDVAGEPPVALYSRQGQMQASFTSVKPFTDMQDALTNRLQVDHTVKPLRAIVVSSGGGHLSEALLAIEGVPLRATIATLRLPHTQSSLQGKAWKTFYLVNPHGNFIKYLKNTLQSVLLVLRDRPEVVISTGAGMVIPTCLIARLLGAKLVFIETAARVTTPSRTGKFLYRFADEFYVQWEPLLKVYPRAKYGGVLL
jgi:predicted nucleotidyltransferase